MGWPPRARSGARDAFLKDRRGAVGIDSAFEQVPGERLVALEPAPDVGAHRLERERLDLADQTVAPGAFELARGLEVRAVAFDRLPEEVDSVRGRGARRDHGRRPREL